MRYNHKQLESPVVNATLGTIRNVNCATICRSFTVGLSRTKVLSSAVVNRIA